MSNGTRMATNEKKEYWKVGNCSSSFSCNSSLLHCLQQEGWDEDNYNNHSYICTSYHSSSNHSCCYSSCPGREEGWSPSSRTYTSSSRWACSRRTSSSCRDCCWRTSSSWGTSCWRGQGRSPCVFNSCILQRNYCCFRCLQRPCNCNYSFWNRCW